MKPDFAYLTFYLCLILVELTSTALKSGPLKNTVPLPVTFQPKGPGHYPCRIILKSAHDTRVYQLECTVSPEGSALELEFISPTHQSVTQDIPVVNTSCVSSPVFKQLAFSSSVTGRVLIEIMKCVIEISHDQTRDNVFPLIRTKVWPQMK